MSHRFLIAHSRGLLLLAWLVPASVDAQVPGQNINMVSGTAWPGGDPFLQRQNEPSLAVSSRSALHILAGANDYRTVDLPGLPNEQVTGDAWLGVFKSLDGGQTWQSTLLPGFPQDTSPQGVASPLKGFTAAADPVVRPGTHGLFYFSGIVFNRGTNLGAVFVSRFMDLNNKEDGDASQDRDPIRYVGAVAIDTGTSGQFLDKPWIATDVPRAGALSCSIPVAPGQTVPGGAVYLAYSRFTGSTSTKIMFTRSRDCGATWSTPIKLSESNGINQGTVIAVDPVSGAVNVAWRRFASSSQGDAIVFARSTDFGSTFAKARDVSAILPFDQGTSAGSFRTNTLPTIAVSVDGSNRSRIHVAWAQRSGPGGDARIVLATSENGTNWSSPSPVDANFLTDDYGTAFSRGHQVMPQLDFSGGKLMLLYYDTRFDHTLGAFAPYDPFTPDAQGRFYLEAREPKGELPANPGAVFGPFVDDAGLALRRHTIDVRVAQANPGPTPGFSSARVSDYRFGTRGDEVGSIGSLQQLQVNPPGLPLFSGGTAAFLGDYVDIAGSTFLPPQSPGGAWTFNTADSSAPVHYATWTSNQDVRPPGDGDWTRYTPVGGGGPSQFDPTQTAPPCATGREGMRNQNIYSSRITQGLHVASPQNTKPLSPTLIRAFVVEVRNATLFDRFFRLGIANQPAGGKASFLKFPGGEPPVSVLDVSIPARSAVARPVFVTSSNPTERIRVEVTELDAVGGGPVPSGLSSFVVLNPDPTTPTLVNPDGGGGGDISVVEIYTPNISNPNISNPNVSNPNVTNPNVSNPNVTNPNVSNPNVLNPDIANPNVTNPNVSNPNVANPNISNPNVSNPNISNAPVSDATYEVTNEGNTTTSYHVKLVGEAPAGVQLQLLLNKTYTTPLGLGCALRAESGNTLLAAIHDAVIESPTQLNDPNIPDSRLSNATFWLRPGEKGLITLRGAFDLALMQQVAQNVVPVLIPHPADPSAENPQYAAPLFITQGALPPATVGAPYSVTLTAIGGTAPYTWSATGLPAGLTLSASGQISGTPSAAGSFTVVLRVVDSAASSHTAQKSLTLGAVQGATTTTLTSSPNPSLLGQPVTFTATVTPVGSTGVPMGTVTFRDGANSLGTVSVGGGSAVLTLSSLAVGVHSITAAYAGDGAFSPSTSTALTQTVATATVGYVFNGFFSPLKTAGTLAAPTFSGSSNLGQGVPIKWQLRDASGALIQRLSTLVTLDAILNTDCAGLPEGPSIRLYAPTSGATGGSTFRFGSNQYIFNWDTSVGVPTGRGCYSLVVQLDDGSAPKVTIVRLR